MNGDCTRELLEEIRSTQERIKNFSVRVEGLSDDLVLSEAESLVEAIKNMIEQKKIAKSNFLKDGTEMPIDANDLVSQWIANKYTYLEVVEEARRLKSKILALYESGIITSEKRDSEIKEVYTALEIIAQS